GAPVSAHPDLQDRGAMSEGFMRERTGDRVTRDPLGAAAAAPRVGLVHAALEDCPVGLEALPGHGQTELIETAERGEVRGREGSVGHVEVFRMGGVRTSIIGRPRPISASPLRAPPSTPLIPMSRFDLPSTMSRSLAGPRFSRTGVRSIITVT